MSDATTALAAAQAAAASASGAADAETGAAESVAAALAHRTAASGFADAALDSAANADTSADLAAASESNAATSAATATTKAGEASSSATAAAASAAHADDMAGAAEAVAVSNDTIIAGRVNDPASATSAALSATIASQAPTVIEAEANDANSGLRMTLNGVYRPNLPRIADLPRPIIIAHRGAGIFIAPENTLSAFKIGASFNFGLIDGGDWRTSADDSLICTHDDDVATLTDKSGSVLNYSTMALSNMTVDSATWFGGTFPNTTLMNDGEFLNTFAGIANFSPEPKTLRAAQLLAARIDKLGLQENVFPTAFSTAFLQPFLDIGCTDVLLNVNAMPTSGERASYLASGIRWIGVPYNGSVTPANVTTLISEGFEVMVGTVWRKYHLTSPNNWDAIKSTISAWASDDPVYFHHALDATKATRYRKTTDPFGNQTYYHGHLPNRENDLPVQRWRGEFLGGNRWGFQRTTTVTPVNAWDLQGWACPLANAAASYTITMDVTFDALGSDTTRWAGCFVCQPTDAIYQDGGASTESGYQVWFRANGELNIQKKVNGSTTGFTAVTRSTTALSAPLTLSSGLASGVAITALPVNAIPSNLAVGVKLKLPTGQTATVATAATAGATSVAISSLTPSAAVASGTSIPQAVTLTIAVTPTTVTATRTDSGGFTAASLTDSVNRGAYWHLGLNDGATTATTGIKVSYSNISIT